MINNSKTRYKEEFDEGSELLWPSDLEDSITRKFYRDLSHFSKNSTKEKKRSSVVVQIFKIIFGKGGSVFRK
tara:strand:+ start:617 stop:832 length:216 start_codon:yes stop_codon:yes gene_type:complete